MVGLCLSPDSRGVQLPKDSRFKGTAASLGTFSGSFSGMLPMRLFLLNDHPVNDLLDTLSGHFTGVPRPSIFQETASSIVPHWGTFLAIQ